jgi:predicted SprT family Zn-dependent metalloprotease
MARTTSADPTTRNYNELTAAYDHFNGVLFDGRLPPCLITLQRKNKALGYFAGGRFGSRDGKEITDEIALNPTHFLGLTVENTLSTLVHEMTHLEQHHFGKPTRPGYHNKQWAGMMRAVGLIPSDTGAPGGRETGQKMTHYIEPGGRFERACTALIKDGFTLPYVELWGEGDAAKKAKKAASKTKYVCETCRANAWAKPLTLLMCGDCFERSEDADLVFMKPELTGDQDED